MLRNAQFYYGSKIFSRPYGIIENGIVDNEIINAIQDVINFPKPLSSYRFSTSLISILKNISPNDENYCFLIRCSIKPLCVPCEEGKAIHFDNNRVAQQAIDDKINFITFRHIAEAIETEKICRTLTVRGVEAEGYLKYPKIRAFLDMLAVVEGTDKDNDGVETGYDVIMGDTPKKPKRLDDLSKHQGNVALGRYQAIPGTWREQQGKLGLADFTPESQEIFAVGKLMDKHMIEDIKNDRFDDAIDKGSPEWASLPNRDKTAENGGTPTSFHVYSRGKNKGKPQPTPYSVNELKGIYEKALKIYKSREKTK